MPLESTPRILPLASVIFLEGMYVPTGENTPLMPARALGAPQTTCTGAPAPVSTMHTRSRSALGCWFASTTWATMKSRSLSAGFSTCSTSRPMRVSVSTISLSEAIVSRWPLSQERVSFIGSGYFLQPLSRAL